jgi:hypothetical protein
MTATPLKLVVVGAAGALIGYFVGTIASGMLTPICFSPNPGLQWGVAVLGAGVGSCAVLMTRPDPRASNRQDPPIRVEE